VTEKVFVKDDADLVAAVERARKEAQASGLPEPKETRLGNIAELKAELERLRRERQQLVRAYHVIIEPVDGAYRAYAPAVPEVEGRGKTPQQAKERLATALRLHLLVRHAEGELPPEENRLVDVVVVSLA